MNVNREQNLGAPVSTSQGTQSLYSPATLWKFVKSGTGSLNPTIRPFPLLIIDFDSQ